MSGEVSAKDIVKGKFDLTKITQKYVYVKAGTVMSGVNLDQLGKALNIMAQHGWRAIYGYGHVVLMENT